ncbi:hypothetical protein B0H17DRAFT_1199206 [Mycena rosella]|uniref:Uncharacterized protein n=1 Tax=Mycena rosella TaxID=1033263 RepID=A0AAD7GH11_MYCRO|nr:hypothetical protein B0H17DRAFT_1199206 [Mycena rosella]
MALVDLGVEEERWQEGQAFDPLRALQNIVKALSALRNRKVKNERKQKQNTVSLSGSPTLPPLIEDDLFMKSVQQKRHVGDSKRTDGLLWRATALPAASSEDNGESIEMGEHTDEEEEMFTVTGTQMDKR